jgi:hypothetical protein
MDLQADRYLERPLGSQATEEEMATVTFVLDTAEAWARGELPLDKAIELTGGADGKKERLLAMRFAPKRSERMRAHTRFCEAVDIHFNKTVYTKHGPLTTADLHEGDARATIEDGKPIIQFAAGYEKSTGRPFYRSKEQRGPNYRQFRPGGQPKPADPAKVAEDSQWEQFTGAGSLAPESKGQLEAEVARLEALIKAIQATED